MLLLVRPQLKNKRIFLNPYFLFVTPFFCLWKPCLLKFFAFNKQKSKKGNFFLFVEKIAPYFILFKKILLKELNFIRFEYLSLFYTFRTRNMICDKHSDWKIQFDHVEKEKKNNGMIKLKGFLPHIFIFLFNIFIFIICWGFWTCKLIISVSLTSSR